MAITRRTHGAATAWTTSQAIPYSASATAGDVCYLVALNVATIDGTPTDWTQIASGTANGYNLKIFKKDTVYAGGDPQPTVGATGGSRGVAWIEHFYSSTAGLTIQEFDAQVALDVTTGSTAFSATGSSQTSATGDWLVGFMGLKSSATMSANASSIVLGQGGATLGTAVGNFGARLSGANPTNSLYYNSFTRPVTTGGTGTPTFTATGGTGAANVAGPAGLMHIREVSTAVNYTATPAEAVGVTDSATDVIDALTDPADGADATDTASPVVDAVRAQDEPVGVTDSAAGVLVPGGVDYTANLSDSVTVTDGGAPQAIVFGENLADPVGVTDMASSETGATRSVADPVGATDSAAPTVDGARTLTDSAGVTDSATATLGASLTVTDTAGITDSATVTLGTDKTASDPVGVTDAATAVMGGSASPADPVGATDAATANVSAVRGPSDTAGISDAITAVMARVVTVADFLALTDTPSTDFTGNGNATVDDPTGITDTTTGGVDRPRPVTDPAGVTDGAVALLQRTRTAADTVTATDAAAGVLQRVALLVDGAGVLDSVTAILQGAALDPGRVTRSTLTQPTVTSTLTAPTCTSTLTAPTVNSSLTAARVTKSSLRPDTLTGDLR